MKSIADIHCHMLPYVDDGAEHSKEMEEMFLSSIKQHVRVLCLTPHLRHGMFNSTDEEIVRRYKQARNFVLENELPLKVYLSREYFCDKHFLERLKTRKLIPLGMGNTLLMEFSRGYSLETILNYLREVQKVGYQPLIAHVERYPVVDLKGVRSLRDAGAKIQVNASSLLGREGRKQKALAWKLLKQEMADVVASDSHDPSYRPPELGACAEKIESKLGKEIAQKVLWENPVAILRIVRGESHGTK